MYDCSDPGCSEKYVEKIELKDLLNYNDGRNKKKEEGMIVVHRLNGTEFVLNDNHIETIEETPDSVITLTNDRKYIVTESAEEIIRMEEEKEEIIEEEEETPKEEEPARRFEASKIIKILLYVAGGILLIVLVTGISYLVAKYVQESSYQKRQDIVAAPPPPPLASYELPDFSQNQRRTPNRIQNENISRLRPGRTWNSTTSWYNAATRYNISLTFILQGKKYEDLNTVSDTVALAEEIKAHVNVILITGKIKEVYFKELVVN